MTMKFVVISGKFHKGYEVHGPFDSLAEADTWGYAHHLPTNYTIQRLQEPVQAKTKEPA